MTTLYSLFRKFSSDGNELVFEVVHYSLKLCYYAFKFKGYICCPAFLVKFFGLTNYACLKISNGGEYFYIFLREKEKVDDPWTKMKDGVSGLQCVHHFSVPIDEDKVLFLDSKNKDTFFLTFRDFFTMEVADEVGIYTRNPGLNPVQLSKCNPCYGYVRKDLKNALNIKYHDLFEGFIFSKVTAIVHVNSATYKKVFELNKPQAQSESEYRTISLMKVYEEAGYAREGYILDKLTDHLKRNYEIGKEEKVGEYYCAMFTILQSSGYGKSRLMERLGSRIPTFYSSLQPGIGYPKASFFLKKLIQELGEAVEKGVLYEETMDNTSPTYNYCYMNNVSTAVYIYILRILYLILTDEKNKDKKLSRYFEIDPAITGHHLFTGLGGTGKKGRIFQMLFKDLEKVCSGETNIVFNGNNTIKLQSSFKFDKSSEPLNLNEFKLEGLGISSYSATGEVLLTDKLEEDVMKLLKQFKQNSLYEHLPSIFVIDEAHGLLYDAKNISEGKKGKYEWNLRDIDLRVGEDEEMKVVRSPYNIFRRVFRMYFYTWEEILLITISTCGQISVLLPELKEDPSRRPENSDKFMDNFALVHTYNANSLDSRKISAGMFRKGNLHGIKNWKEFLISKFRKIEYFKLGRPLTYGYFKQSCGEKSEG